MLRYSPVVGRYLCSGRLHGSSASAAISLDMLRCGRLDGSHAPKMLQDVPVAHQFARDTCSGCISRHRNICIVEKQSTRRRTFARHASSLTSNNFNSQSRQKLLEEQTQTCLNDDDNIATELNCRLNLNCSQNNCNITDDKGVDKDAPVEKTSLSVTNTSPPPGSLLSGTFKSDNEGAVGGNHDNKDIQPLVPPDPETCCGSGCVNCVYIKYVQDVLERDPNDRGKVKNILEEIEDYNVRMFIKLELGL